MKTYFLCITIFANLLFSCNEKGYCDLLEIPVDIEQNSPLPLSEITEKLTAIELELTDESVVNPMSIQNVFLLENEVFIATMHKIFVFNKEGKYLRSIGSIGQGPGEYSRIGGCALDEKKGRLFIYGPKIISYDLNGNFLKESNELSATFRCDINYINGELLFLVRQFIEVSNGTYSRSELLHINDDLQVVDSFTLLNLFYENIPGFHTYRYGDFILENGKNTSVYYGDFYIRFNGEENFFCDTLFRFEKKQFIPELKLKFKKAGVNRFIVILYIYKSSRYVFAGYFDINKKNFYVFCYDTKTKKGYIDEDGVIDDINQIFPARIRPFKNDTEMFYYLHTNMKPNDLEEPNPTLYIGKLKK